MYQNRTKLILLVSAAFVAGFLISVFSPLRDGDAGVLPVEESCGDPQLVSVEITGSVINPGVYDLNEGERLIDLIKTAGGFADDYDYKWVRENLNLSQILKDEQKILIPPEDVSFGAAGADPSIKVFTMPKSTLAAESSGSATPVETGGGDTKVNVNEATFEELDALPGIGEAYAGKIVANRPYSGGEEFKQKSGLSNSIYEKIKDLISF